ncbi:alpha/beta fold hydrolase [Streptacidiphilus sp. N1-12]|uniref:Alpha/beta fold hydrolase n=2 Tax=Streptacidiphilus alkalitolerans TaxID=3342712 RepID=A0ABV6WNK4_9ACTN
MTQPATGAAPPGTPAAQEFADLADPESPAPPPTVERRWVTVTTGGHISGVFWGSAAPELLLLHDSASSARSWDGLLLVLDRPAVAVDLPGHGRSSQRADLRPRRLAAGLAQAAHSFAPPGVPVVGRGLGALAAIAVTAKAPGVLGRLVLLDTLPGSPAETGTGAPADAAGTAADDEALWAQLAAVPDPVLVRTEGGPLGDDLADRFRAEVPHGETTISGADPDALAATLRALLQLS